MTVSRRVFLSAAVATGLSSAAAASDLFTTTFTLAHPDGRKPSRRGVRRLV